MAQYIADRSQRDHVRTVCGGEREFPCTHPNKGTCDYAATSKRNLDRHMKTHVAGRVKDVACTVEGCEAMFFDVKGMDAHVKSAIHNPVKVDGRRKRQGGEV